MLQKVKRKEINIYSVQMLQENLPKIYEILGLADEIIEIRVTMSRRSVVKALLVRSENSHLGNISVAHGSFIVVSEDGSIEVLSGDVYHRKYVEVSQ